MTSEIKHSERIYTIPLRRFWFNARSYERTSRAVKAIKQFVAKHMKVEDRDLDKVKLDVYFNNELWYRGRASPPSKIKVKVIKEGDIVKVDFAEHPKHVSFSKIKHLKIHSKAKVAKETPEFREETKTEEQKKDEKEKEISTAIAKEAQIKQDVRAEKHTTKAEKAQRPQRMALQK